MELQIITTGDHSHTLFNSVLNETYHSRHGAIAESSHIFIQKGLLPLYESGNGPLHIFEVGFGTGLNAMLTLNAVNANNLVYYHTIEKFPLNKELLQQLNYSGLLETYESNERFHQIHNAEWNTETAITPEFLLRKIKGDLLLTELTYGFYDLIYFDAFAPTKQPEMWTQEVLFKMYNILKPGGVLVTYCSQGQFKRDLKSVGFRIEALPGPPGKREMTKAIRIH